MITSSQNFRSQLGRFTFFSTAHREIKAFLDINVNDEPQRPKQKIVEDLKQDSQLNFFIATNY